MQHEQFTNPHYKKILEKVIKHRHPEWSFEEGLKMETKHIGCLLYALDEMRIVINNQDKMISSIIGKNPFEDKLNESSITSNISSRSKCCQILGRPITICEIVDVLACNIKPYTRILYDRYEKNADGSSKKVIQTLKNQIYYGMDYDRKYGILELDVSDNDIDLNVPNLMVEIKSKTYYLHEQPIEVQEKISNLF